MTIINEQKLVDTLTEYLQHQLIHNSKKGVLIHFDGSLSSLINYKIATLINPKILIESLVIVFNQNKLNILNLTTLASSCSIKTSIYDASNFPIPFGQTTISSKRRVEDLVLGLVADTNNFSVLGNLSYSHWCINFPHNNYKNPEHLFLLNRLFYSELKQLSQYLGIAKAIVDREPILDFVYGKTIKDNLGFSFEELESFLRSNKDITRLEHSLIQQRINIDDNLLKFNSPVFQRPSNLLT